MYRLWNLNILSESELACSWFHCAKQLSAKREEGVLFNFLKKSFLSMTLTTLAMQELDKASRHNSM